MSAAWPRVNLLGIGPLFALGLQQPGVAATTPTKVQRSGTYRVSSWGDPPTASWGFFTRLSVSPKHTDARKPTINLKIHLSHRRRRSSPEKRCASTAAHYLYAEAALPASANVCGDL